MSKDTEILKELGERLAKIAALPIHEEKKKMWRKHNGLQNTRPMVCLDQLPWHELNIDDELTLLCEDEFLRSVEKDIRKTLYRWKRFPADMVVESRVDVPKTVKGLNYGLIVVEETLATDAENDVVSHKYIDQCETEEALSMIKPDVITVDPALDQEHLEICNAIFKDIIPVRLSGVSIHSGVWDRISQARPVNTILMDIIDRPDFTKLVAEKFLALTMSTVDQCEALGILDPYDPLVHCTGSYVDDLPSSEYDPNKPLAKDCWSFAMAQMFSTVSPAMHDELEIDIMRPLFERFGLMYYGCCEPLDQKINIIKKIKNVRKISISPWAKINESAQQLAGQYVFSGKAHPVHVTLGVLDEVEAKKQAVEMMQACKRNHTPCEIILKDVSTVSGKPEVLSQWEKLIMSLVEEL